MMNTIINTNYNEDLKELKIEVCKRIDSNNSGEFSKELEQLENNYDINSIVLDMTNTEYLSSSGLRVLLSTKKKYENTSLIGVDSGLYEILDITGMTQIMKCERKIKEYSIDGLEMIARGSTARIYRVDSDTILKVFTSDFDEPKIRREMEVSKEAFVSGIATAIPYEIVKVGDSFGTIYEMVKADTLSVTMHKSNEMNIEWSKKFANFIKEMHKVKLDTNKFLRSKDRYEGWEKVVLSMVDEESGKIYSELIDSIPEAETFIHGDCHPNNIMIQNGELLLIDMGEASYGSPIGDLMTFGGVRLLADFVPDEVALSLIGMTTSEVKTSWETFVKEYFNVDGEEYEKINNTLMLYSCIRSVIVSITISQFREKLLPVMLMTMKKLNSIADKDLSFLN